MRIKGFSDEYDHNQLAVFSTFLVCVCVCDWVENELELTRNMAKWRVLAMEWAVIYTIISAEMGLKIGSTIEVKFQIQQKWKAG